MGSAVLTSVAAGVVESGTECLPVPRVRRRESLGTGLQGAARTRPDRRATPAAAPPWLTGYHPEKSRDRPGSWRGGRSEGVSLLVAGRPQCGGGAPPGGGRAAPSPGGPPVAPHHGNI